jgi:hypothetical protein
MGVIIKPVTPGFVALKMLRLQRTADLERKRRFVQEAKAASVCGSQKVISMAR